MPASIQRKLKRVGKKRTTPIKLLAGDYDKKYNPPSTTALPADLKRELLKNR